MRSGRENEAERLFEEASGLCRSMGLLLPDIRTGSMAHINSA
jgi:hypothetical protein